MLLLCVLWCDVCYGPLFVSSEWTVYNRRCKKNVKYTSIFSESIWCQNAYVSDLWHCSLVHLMTMYINRLASFVRVCHHLNWVCCSLYDRYFQIPRLFEFTQPFFLPAQTVLQTYFFLLRSISVSHVDIKKLLQNMCYFLKYSSLIWKWTFSLGRRIFCPL